MKQKLHKRTLKECEEIISSLQKKLWKRDEVLREMRMALYRANKAINISIEEIDGIWFHHLDGSDLLVSKNELFDITQNKVIGNCLKPAKRAINKPLLRLKEFIEW